ncbi:Auxin-responsive protein [Heracleum sosnowskyi]|uniref:Auxin-responsive protein n=1 Tax=Heracleum sosnowskyi TaxID=360622 RepID=A0AAD8M3K2_9APIA|nr:Auxin-responsive protein [Heracleum sosnowskyi]
MEEGFSRNELELRLAPPGNSFSTITTCSGSKRGLEKSWLNESQTHKFSSLESLNTPTWSCSKYYDQQKDLLPVMKKESSQRCCNKGLVSELQNTTEKQQQTFLTDASAVKNTAGPNTSQNRNAPAPVVGWPPIRSFRKNIASNNSSKLKVEPKQQNLAPPLKSANEKQVENCCKGLFVKINMDGVPIGRKVDLKAYDSYEKLSCSVDELFRGLLAAQRDPSDDKIQNEEGDKLITGLLDGRGEYTLVYEDNEGDRMLVGDVPWHMFVCTVKRLRVLKSSDLSSLFASGSKQGKNSTDATLRQ